MTGGNGSFPRTRGMYPIPKFLRPPRAVSPAHAGMYHRTFRPGLRLLSFPRTRGDVPKTPSAERSTPRFPRTRGDIPAWVLEPKVSLQFPPHTRGCTRRRHHDPALQPVSPAHAGMCRCQPIAEIQSWRFPRTRGDVPWPNQTGSGWSWFPPHTRGYALLLCPIEVYPSLTSGAGR